MRVEFATNTSRCLCVELVAKTSMAFRGRTVLSWLPKIVGL